MSLTLEAVGARSVACASIEEKFVDVAGCRVRYLTGGRGPALLLVHGLLAYSFSWRFNLQALAQHATVYAPDLPGMGFSQRVPNPAPGLAPTAEIILDFMKTLGISSASLLGSSHGGGAVRTSQQAGRGNSQRLHEVENYLRRGCQPRCRIWHALRKSHARQVRSINSSVLRQRLQVEAPGK